MYMIQTWPREVHLFMGLTLKLYLVLYCMVFFKSDFQKLLKKNIKKINLMFSYMKYTFET